MTDYPSIPEFTPNPGVNVHSENPRSNLKVINIDGTETFSKKEYNSFTTKDEAAQKCKLHMQHTGTKWVITYNTDIKKYHVLPDPNDQRNNTIFKYKYEERVDAKYVTYQYSGNII